MWYSKYLVKTPFYLLCFIVLLVFISIITFNSKPIRYEVEKVQTSQQGAYVTYVKNNKIYKNSFYVILTDESTHIKIGLWESSDMGNLYLNKNEKHRIGL